ncbi:MAG: thioredoxin family protein [Actinomycetota bacterium]|nr:thioredoxin family protein [Actinomycetota bacterium]
MAIRLGVTLGLVALIALGAWAWRRREGRFSEAGGAFDRAALGLTSRDKASAVMVEFSGEHCGTCRILEGRLSKLAGEIPDVRVVNVKVEDNPSLADRYDVKRVPALFVTDPGLNIVWRATGLPSEDAIRQVLLGPEWAGRPQPKSLSRRRPLRRRRTITLHEEGVACEVTPGK